MDAGIHGDVRADVIGLRTCGAGIDEYAPYIGLGLACSDELSGPVGAAGQKAQLRDRLGGLRDFAPGFGDQMGHLHSGFIGTHGLVGLGQPVKYGYWDFGTDLSVICGRDKKPAVGYSPMQEFYCHRPIDKVRTDFMEQAIAGNAAIFLELAKLPKDGFSLA